jgi:hypothetical protein
MAFANLLKLAQTADKKIQRWRRDETRKVLVDARRPMNYSVIAPVHNAFKSDPRVEFCFTASEDPSRAREIFREAGPDVAITTPRRAFSTRFDAYLVADLMWLPLPRGACRVFMFHGVAGKYSNVYDAPEQSMREWDRLFFINRRRLTNFISAKAIDADSTAAKLIGMPKVDCLADGSFSRDFVLAGLGLDPAKPTVLYAPTWSAHSSLNVMGQEIIQRLGQAGYTVLVKLHDGSRMAGHFFSGGVDWQSELMPAITGIGGHLADGGDASPLLAAADLLVTDHSSVGFEYLLLDRPVVRIHIPELIANANINPVYVDILSEVSTTITDAGEITRAVEDGLVNSRRKSAIRKAVAGDLFHDAGSATSRAVSELYNVLELDRPAENKLT